MSPPKKKLSDMNERDLAIVAAARNQPLLSIAKSLRLTLVPQRIVQIVQQYERLSGEKLDRFKPPAKQRIHGDKRQCIRCERLLPLSEFTRDKYVADGLNARCRDCAHAIERSSRERAEKRDRRNYFSLYRTTHNAKRREYQTRRDARKNNVLSTFTADDWQILVARSPHCHWCKRLWTRARRPTHDHVIPLSKGGANSLENSVCACRECNTKKHANLRNPVTNEGILI